MDDQIIIAILDVLDKAMSILQTEEDVTVTASWSTWRLKHHRRYVNRDREVAYFKLWHDYFNDDYVYPIILLLKVSYAEDFFSKHYT
jgi:hypothetical protein